MRGAARCVAAAGRVCGEGEAAARSRTAVGRSRARCGSVLLQEKKEEAGGGHVAPPQRICRTHTRLVQHLEWANHR